MNKEQQFDEFMGHLVKFQNLVQHLLNNPALQNAPTYVKDDAQQVRNAARDLDMCINKNFMFFQWLRYLTKDGLEKAIIKAKGNNNQGKYKPF